MEALVGALEHAAAALACSLKFGKLLLTVITMHSKQLANHKTRLEQVALRTTTFMTKAVLAKLKRM